MNYLWNLARHAGRSCFLRGESFHQSCLLLQPGGIKPTRPPSSFGLFLQERKNTYSPEMKAESGNFLRFIASEWKKLDFPLKEGYALKAQQAMAAYKESMRSLSDEEKQEIYEDKMNRQLSKAKRKEKKEKKTLGFPKRPTSAYSFYVKHVFATRPVGSGSSPREVMNSAKSKWDGLPLEEKERFATMASRDKERYLDEMKAVVERLRDEGKSDLVPTPYRKMWLSKESKSWEDINRTW